MTTPRVQPDEPNAMGPVSYLIVEFPGSKMRAIELRDIDGQGQFDVAIFEGASSRLLNDSDIADARSVIEPGSSVGILIFENRWASAPDPSAAPRRRGTGSRRIHPARHHRRVARRNRPLIQQGRTTRCPGSDLRHSGVVTTQSLWEPERVDDGAADAG